jgi:hypothetical protein
LVQVGDIAEVREKSEKMTRDMAARKGDDRGQSKAEEMKDVPSIEKMLSEVRSCWLGAR